MSNHDWMAKAECLGEDPELFFDAQSVEEALNVCNGCPVRNDCLEYAVTQELRYGIWGGTTETQRDPMIRKHNAMIRGGSIAVRAAS